MSIYCSILIHPQRIFNTCKSSITQNLIQECFHVTAHTVERLTSFWLIDCTSSLHHVCQFFLHQPYSRTNRCFHCTALPWKHQYFHTQDHKGHQYLQMHLLVSHDDLILNLSFLLSSTGILKLLKITRKSHYAASSKQSYRSVKTQGYIRSK